MEGCERFNTSRLVTQIKKLKYMNGFLNTMKSPSCIFAVVLFVIIDQFVMKASQISTAFGVVFIIFLYPDFERKINQLFDD